MDTSEIDHIPDPIARALAYSDLRSELAEKRRDAILEALGSAPPRGRRAEVARQLGIRWSTLHAILTRPDRDAPTDPPPPAA